MKKRITLVLTLTLLLLTVAITLASCADKSPKETTSDPNSVTVTYNVGGRTEKVLINKGETPIYLGSTIKPSDDTSTYRFIGWDKEFAPANEDVTYTALYDTVPLVEYTVRWMFFDGDVTTKVKENDVPVPPVHDSVIVTNQTIATFTGWQVELLPLTQERASSIQNLFIKALYDSVDRTYDVKFMVDGQLYATTKTTYNATPTLPETNPTKAGYSSVMWLGSDQAITDNEQVCTAVFTVNDGAQLLWALNNTSQLSYKGTTADNGSTIMTAANRLLFLAYEIRNTETTNPYYSTYLDTVVEQLKLMVDQNEDGAPYFELSCNWPYCNLTALITLCKETPAIWNSLTADEQQRYDFIMECFAYILALGTDDDNNYKTGPGLVGNFGKGWNPNYRLANIMPMVFVGKYFGGAAAVDEILLAFDYDSVVAKFQEYGFLRAYNRWTTTPAQKDDGTFYPTPEDYMMNGGEIFLNTTDDRLHYVPGTSGGTGVGVRTNYTYGGRTLDEPGKIIASLFSNNYSGGAVKSSYGTYSDGTPKAYIEGYLTSPYEGELGLMLEFAGSDGGNGVDGGDIRSSTSYCSHDFIMIVGALISLTELDIYDPMDNENLSLFRFAWVGNQDLIFKLEKGYMSYSLGASKGVSYESTSNGYMLMKAWWNMKYGDLSLESFPEPEIVFDPVIFEENFSGSSINANSSSVNYNDADYAANGKQGASMTTVADGSNSYLRFQVNAGGGDPMINIRKTGGLALAMGEYKSFTVSVDLAKVEGLNVISLNYRLRAGNTSNVSSVFRTTSTGAVVFGPDSAPIEITTLTTEFQTISVKVDFEAELMTAFVNGVEVASTPLVIPAVTATSENKAETGLAWLDTIGSYIVNWYCGSCKDNADDRALLIDNIKIRADAPLSPDEEAGGESGGFEE